MDVLRADFKAIFVDFVPYFSSAIAASFVFISAFSFPSISMCPAIHIIDMFIVAHSCLISSTSSRIFCMIVCPDCCPDFLVVLIAA